MTPQQNNSIQQRQPRDSGARIGARYAQADGIVRQYSATRGGGDIDIMTKY